MEVFRHDSGSRLCDLIGRTEVGVVPVCIRGPSALEA